MFLRTVDMQRMVEDVELPIDGMTHINHDDCPAGVDVKARLYIRRVRDGWLFYCHHCGGKGRLRSSSILSAETLLSSISVSEDVNDVVSVLDGYAGEEDVSKWPVCARLWWRGYELDQEDATLHRVQWYGDRLWMDADGHAWQGRTFDSNVKQKYLTYIYNRNVVPKNIGNDVVVVTEDLVSSYKVVKTGFSSVPLLGTKLNLVTLNYLTSTYKKCIVWLDDDVAGRVGSMEVVKSLKPLMEVKQITYMQPKEVYLPKLQEMLTYA